MKPTPNPLVRAPLRAAAWLAAVLAGLAGATPAGAEADAQRGARLARQCLACHSFVPGRHLSGPSLAGLWGRRAGTAPGFVRYSDALARSELVWEQATLDAWLRDPQALVAGNTMSFAGLPDAARRADLLAFLRAASDGSMKLAERSLPVLSQAGTEYTVKSIHYCGDAYRVVTGDGETQVFWEFNLRFKTDGSASGPAAGRPVLIDNGMRGDRAAVVFARPEEIAQFVQRRCS